jgi:hypothetical protein
MFFPIKLKGHLRLIESDPEPMHDSDSNEPILEVVEGDVAAPGAETAIVPNAFESVLAKYDENQPPKYVEPEAPAYKNRALIAAVCIVGGILAGRYTTQPKVETVVVNKDRPVLVANQNPAAPAPKVDNAFRDLADLNAFDPWQPMNGGFPLPPKETQANIVSRSGAPSTEFRPSPPPRMRGDITPMDPTEITGPLPDVNGKGIMLPENPAPGGGTVLKPKPGQDGHSTVVAPTPKDEPAGKERYVAMSVNGPDPTQGQSSLVGLASSLGGSARTFSHMNEDGTVEAQGVLLIIPASKYEQAKSKIEALGGASIETNVEGNASGEQSKIQSMFVARLTKLKDKQKDLLVDFLDDAQPVKQVKEAIDLETRAVSATRLPGGLSGKVVIRVMLK